MTSVDIVILEMDTVFVEDGVEGVEGVGPTGSHGNGASEQSSREVMLCGFMRLSGESAVMWAARTEAKEGSTFAAGWDGPAGDAARQ